MDDKLTGCTLLTVMVETPVEDRDRHLFEGASCTRRQGRWWKTPRAVMTLSSRASLLREKVTMWEEPKRQPVLCQRHSGLDLSLAYRQGAPQPSRLPEA